MAWQRREKDLVSRLRRRRIDRRKYGVLEEELRDIKPRRPSHKGLVVLGLVVCHFLAFLLSK